MKTATAWWRRPSTRRCSDAVPKVEAKALATLRAAVKDKNFHWYNRYRTTDGFSIYGGRAD